MGKRVLLTGATGYIGGGALYELLHSNLDLEIVCPVRSEAKAKTLPKEVKTPIITNEDTELLTEAAANADIVIHTANSADDPVGPPAIVKGLARRGGWYIHVSGTGVLTEQVEGRDENENIYYDKSGIDKIHQISDPHPHRLIDKYVLDVEKHHPNIKTIIVAPPTIHGLSKGYDNIISIQIPRLMEAALFFGQAKHVGPGKNIWGQVHVDDLSVFFRILVERIIHNPDSLAHGYDGYYFCEDGEYAWGDAARHVGKIMYEKGLIKTPEAASFTDEDIEKLKKQKGYSMMGASTTSRGRAERARELGWKPQAGDIFSSMPAEIDHLVKKGGEK